MKYKNKPFTIDAIQWTGNNEEEVEEFVGWYNVSFAYKIFEGYSVRIIGERPECEKDIVTAYAIIRGVYGGIKTATAGDFIARDMRGEIVLYNQKVFESRFEKLEVNEHF